MNTFFFGKQRFTDRNQIQNKRIWKHCRAVKYSPSHQAIEKKIFEFDLFENFYCVKFSIFFLVIFFNTAWYNFPIFTYYLLSFSSQRLIANFTFILRGFLLLIIVISTVTMFLSKGKNIRLKYRDFIHELPFFLTLLYEKLRFF